MKQLETERLIIRAWKESDLPDLLAYAKNQNVGHWAPTGDLEAARLVLQSFMEKDEVWALQYKDNDKVIGALGLQADPKRSNTKTRMIGYSLSEKYWGKGLMAEAVKRVIRHAFEELSIDLVSIYHNANNDRSRRLIEKCGFQYEGTLRLANVACDGRVCDELCYSLAKEDYTDY